jgi:hypothetical protein
VMLLRREAVMHHGAFVEAGAERRHGQYYDELSSNYATGKAGPQMLSGLDLREKGDISWPDR